MLKEHEFKRKYLSDSPPEGLDLQVGDIVTFTNPQRVVFHGRTVIGFADGKVHLSGDTPYWFGIEPNSLKLEVRP